MSAKGVFFFWLLMFFPTAVFGQSLKLMTYNIRLDVAVDGPNNWTHRKDFLTSQIRFYEPDVLGVQEALPNQVVDMTRALLAYNHVGIGREGEGKGEASSIFYKKDRLDLIETNTFWLSQTPGEISKGWDAAYNRVCTYALFEDKQSGHKFWVFNTHLDHVGEVARTNGIQLILSEMEAMNTKGYPVFFMGDFNSEPNADRILALKKRMDDCREVSKEKPFGPSGTFNNFKHNEPVTRLIDYIFMSKQTSCIVLKYGVLSDSDNLMYPSDHLPVLVEVKMP